MSPQEIRVEQVGCEERGSRAAASGGWPKGPTRVARATLRADQEHLRDRKGVRMCDGEQRGACAHRRKASRGSAMQLKLRGATSTDNLHVAPENVLRVPRAQRLHSCFFCSEPAGKVSRGLAATHAVCDFTLGEHAAQKSLAITLDGCR